MRALDCLAHLHFCRMRLSAYSALLQAVLTAAAGRTMARPPSTPPSALSSVPASAN